MRYFSIAGLFVLTGTLAASRAPLAPPLTTAELEAKMLAAIDNVRTLRYSVAAQERVAGRLLPMRSVVKYTPAPLRIYLKNDQRVEVLYVAGQNSNDAWVYPGAFPYLTVSLDPQGSLMRRNQHHTVLQVGYGLVASLLRESDPAYVRSFRYAADSTVAGQPCYVLRSVYPAFRYVPYRAGANETTASVAARFNCGEYRILERNKLDAGTRLQAGQTLQVPSAYGSRTTVVLDQRTFLPVAIAVHDERGLYERYDFSNVVVNQPIPAAEFSKEFKGYKF